jgi:hypothetical protein
MCCLLLPYRCTLYCPQVSVTLPKRGAGNEKTWEPMQLKVMFTQIIVTEPRQVGEAQGPSNSSAIEASCGGFPIITILTPREAPSLLPCAVQCTPTLAFIRSRQISSPKASLLDIVPHYSNRENRSQLRSNLIMFAARRTAAVFDVRMAAIAAAAATLVACCAATAHQPKHCQGFLSYNPSVARGNAMGSFFDQHYQQCPSEGIDRNDRLEHEQHAKEATGQDEEAQAAKGIKL